MRRDSAGMRTLHRLAVSSLSIALVACTGTGRSLASMVQLRAEAPTDATARFTLAGDRIVASAVPLGPGTLPPGVRTTFEAVAPGGTTTFVGRETGPRGDGFRLDKVYTDGLRQTTRSVLADSDGRVLERWHTVPIPEVPQHVLAVALRTGPVIEEARIVSGPEREEHWTFLVRDRSARPFVVTVGLAGEPMGRLRRSQAVVDG